MRVRIAAVVLAVLGIAAYFLSGSSGPNGADEGQYTKLTLPGYRIALPSWKGSVGSRYWFDSVKLEEPGGGGHFIELRWSAGPPEPDNAIGLVEAMLGAKIQSRTPTTAAGKPSTLVYLQDPSGSRAWAFTPFDCADGRSAYLLTFVNRPKDGLLAVHQRALDSLTCAPDAAPPRAYPKVTLPAGFTMTEQTSGRTYAAAGHRYFFSSGVPGPGFSSDFDRNDGLRVQIIAAEFAAKSVDVEPLRSDGGLPRIVWSGSATREDGGVVQVMATALYCAGANESFFAYHADERPGVDDAAIIPLWSASCP